MFFFYFIFQSTTLFLFMLKFIQEEFIAFVQSFALSQCMFGTDMSAEGISTQIC